MVLVRKWPFFQICFFQAMLARKMFFYDILERKKAVLRYKNKKFKSRKIGVFPKGLTHGFGPKMAISLTFFLGNIGQKNVFYDILERKKAFLRYKNKKFKKSKIWHFSKGLTHGFGPKMAIFPTFFLRQYRPGKCLLRCSRTKKRLSRL